MYANELAAERRASPRDDIIIDAARRRGRRRHALRDGLQPLLPADRGRRQRDDAQLDLARHPRVLRQPRPVPAARGRPVARGLGDRGDRALGVAGHVLPPQRHHGHRARGQKLKEGDKVEHLVHRREPRRRGLRRPVRRSTSAARPTSTSASAAAARTTASARTSPAWRSTCCSRRWPAASRRSSSPATCSRLRSNFIGGIKHMPVSFSATGS